MYTPEEIATRIGLFSYLFPEVIDYVYLCPGFKVGEFKIGNNAGLGRILKSGAFLEFMAV